MIWPPVGLIFDNFGNPSIYYIYNIETFKILLVSFLEGFGTFPSDFTIFYFYCFKAVFTQKTAHALPPDLNIDM